MQLSKGDAVKKILAELRKAEAKHQGWPSDMIYGASILAEETGELIQAANDYELAGKDNYDLLINEAAQVGAMALRFMMHVSERGRRS